jgi:hypothetical protein
MPFDTHAHALLVALQHFANVVESLHLSFGSSGFRDSVYKTMCDTHMAKSGFI